MLLGFMSFLFVFDFNSLLDMQFVNIFSNSIGCLSLAVQKLCGLMYSHLFLFTFIACVSFVISIKLLRSMSRSFPPMFSSKSFMVPGHTFVFNPLQINYYGVIHLIIFHVNIKFFSKPFIEETIFSPLNILGSLFKYYLTVYVWVYSWALDSIP